MVGWFERERAVNVAACWNIASCGSAVLFGRACPMPDGLPDGLNSTLVKAGMLSVWGAAPKECDGRIAP